MTIRTGGRITASVRLDPADRLALIEEQRARAAGGEVATLSELVREAVRKTFGGPKLPSRTPAKDVA